MSRTGKFSVFCTTGFIAIRSSLIMTGLSWHDLKRPNVKDGNFPGLNTEYFRLIIMLEIGGSEWALRTPLKKSTEDSGGHLSGLCLRLPLAGWPYIQSSSKRQP